jgi:dihydroneopterin aldolase
MSDILRLKKMTFHGYHGLFPEERKLGQKYEVDVEIRADLSPSRGCAVFDYTQVYDHVEAIVTGETFELVEALADRIATSLVERFHFPEVLVRVHKPAPPFRGHFDGVEVEVVRTKCAIENVEHTRGDVQG